MTLSVTATQVMADLGKDESTYMSDRVSRQMSAAKASLSPAIGYWDGVTEIPAKNADAFDKLGGTYVTEYCRAQIDGVDNERMLVALLLQMAALMKSSEA